jgi:hypothetical protein
MILFCFPVFGLPSSALRFSSFPLALHGGMRKSDPSHPRRESNVLLPQSARPAVLTSRISKCKGRKEEGETEAAVWTLKNGENSLHTSMLLLSRDDIPPCGIMTRDSRIMVHGTIGDGKHSAATAWRAVQWPDLFGPLVFLGLFPDSWAALGA